MGPTFFLILVKITNLLFEILTHVFEVSKSKTIMINSWIVSSNLIFWNSFLDLSLGIIEQYIPMYIRELQTHYHIWLTSFRYEPLALGLCPRTQWLMFSNTMILPSSLSYLLVLVTWQRFGTAANLMKMCTSWG